VAAVEVGMTEDIMEAFSGVFRLVHKKTAHCNHTRVIGGSGQATNQVTEGSWTVCYDPWDKLPNQQPEQPCVVYSFGIANDFSFDDNVVKLLGCEVHSFDPSMNQQSHSRGNKSKFWNIGISDKASTDYEGVAMATQQKQIWTVMPLDVIMKSLNHTHLLILKIDVEYSEWSALLQMLRDRTLDHVDQVLFEVHFWPARDRNQRPWEIVIREWAFILQELRRQGFAMFYHHQNPGSPNEVFDRTAPRFGYACCYEISWIRVSPPPMK